MGTQGRESVLASGTDSTNLHLSLEKNMVRKSLSSRVTPHLL